LCQSPRLDGTMQVVDLKAFLFAYSLGNLCPDLRFRHLGETRGRLPTKLSTVAVDCVNARRHLCNAIRSGGNTTSLRCPSDGSFGP
jgi:hypothetical protein